MRINARSNRSLSAYGAPFCRGVEPFLDNLKTLLDEATRQGVQGFDAVMQAQATYDDVNGIVVYIPLVGDDCARHTAEVQAAIAKVTTVLKAIPGANTYVPRPDATAPDPSAIGVEIPTWLKFAGFGLLGVIALGYLSPLIGLAGRRGMAEYEPEDRLDGYRRRRKSKR